MLIITVPVDDYTAKAGNIFNYLKQSLPLGKIESVTENQDNTVISYSFNTIEDDMILKIKQELLSISNQISSNFFFNRIGDI